MVSSSWFRARFISLAWLEDPTTWHLVKKITHSWATQVTNIDKWYSIYVLISIFVKKSFLAQDLTRHILLRLSSQIEWLQEVLAKSHRASAAVPGNVGSVDQLQHQMFCFPFRATNRCWNHKNGKNDPFLVSARYYKDLLLAHTQHNNLRHIISFPRCSILRKIMAYLPTSNPSNSWRLVTLRLSRALCNCRDKVSCVLLSAW